MKENIKYCIKDRVESFEHIKVGWLKKNGFDLLLKYFILLVNGIGKENKTNYVFVDEINNSNMRNNLFTTKNVFDLHNESTLVLRFYEINREDHIRFGYLKPIFEIIILCFFCLIILIASVLGVNKIEYIIRFLYFRFSRLSKQLERVKEIYLMTDHHFYSSVLAFNIQNRCTVLQHGLIMDKRFYYPIRASKFCAWGEKSWELQNKDPKVIISGTYKFSGMNCNTSAEVKRIMFCIGSLDNDVVKRKIDILVNIKKSIGGFKLLIKCHPGSLFDCKQWEDLYALENMEFYKEELLSSIDFDLAISENSTAIMDFIAMRKPFILFDDINGYYSDYKHIIPNGNSQEKIEEIIGDINKIDFSLIIDKLRARELNNGKCMIYEKRRI